MFVREVGSLDRSTSRFEYRKLGSADYHRLVLLCVVPRFRVEGVQGYRL